ncbi:hypothetical protein [Vibrio parahaemolyticus]|uniref:hypothetical protein n=1 Tax=Vibrio parahaemolyticus TaxID=670 RepID=UPI00226BBC88|nr:hypothetical protein [Vibrio parahaemolyticus]MCX8818360.1 hypothetical protein [Vibrio parahaemolyticus]MCX8914803.1 hypothetical protein [Vibrio parahaemolyticus]
MATNIVVKSKVERKYNARVMGSNKLTYIPYTPNLAANDINYSDGKLKQASTISINYDVAGKFPEQKFAEALTPATTELAQAHAKEVSFTYHRQPTHVEFTLSNMQDVSDVNINAGILNRMLMQYDYEHFHGAHGNAGMFNNSNSVELDSTVVAIASMAEVFKVIEALYSQMAVELGVTEADYPNITLSYTSDIASIIRKPLVISGDSVTTGKTQISSAYAGMVQKEVPSVIRTGSHISLTYRPAVNNHHGSIPGIYSKADGDAHGLTQKTLFTYESAANEIEGYGAYVYQKTSTAAAKAAADRAKAKK